MSARRMGVIACVVVLLIGCHKMVTVNPDQYDTLKGDNKAVVVTTSGHEYEYRSFRIEQQEFVGTDGKGKGAAPGPAPSRIPLAEIAVLKVKKIDAARTALLAGGVAAATVIIVLAAKLAHEAEEFQESCPYVFSFDGTRYRFDSETYAGAIFAGAERTDYDNLDFLAPLGGNYRLQVRNARQETQYTNQLALLVVDHPGGTRVLPDARGGLHALHQLVPPSSASDYANRDVLSLVTQRDEVSWESDLSARSF
ncbi:MAG: hypothetical protein GWN58_64630, partial [Anaerolineae bacterium]|nr:hypothetical protein [Anaerolineae bacterium]